MLEKMRPQFFFDRFISQFRFLPYALKYIFENPLRLYKFPLYLFIEFLNKKIVISPAGFGQYKLILDPKSGINRTLFFRGGSYPGHRLFISRNLKKDSVFFDIGAHSGFFSIFASTIIKTGTIHAFEPIPSLCKDFKKSIALNKIKNIKVNQFCLGEKNGKTSFHLSTILDHSGILETKLQSLRNKRLMVKVVKLQTYCKQNKIEKMDLIKFDVEGGEKDILFPAKDLIMKFQPLIIIEFSTDTTPAYNYHPNEIYDFLEELGYDMYKLVRNKLKMLKKKGTYCEDIFCIPQSKKYIVKL